MNVNITATRTKVTKLTALNVSAIEGWAEDLKADTGKTTATFEGTAKEAAARVRQVQEKIAAVQGRKAGAYASLHAVARKLEEGKDITVVPAPAADEAEAATPHTDAAAKAEEMKDAFHGKFPANAPKLELVVDSTDKNANPGGVFGKSVQQAVEEETAKRGAMKAADEFLARAGYTKDQKPGWGTAKTHKLNPGDTYLFFGRDRKTSEPGELRTFKHNQVGGAATRFWAIKIADALPDADAKVIAGTTKGKAEKPADSKKAAPAKKSAGARAIPQEAANSARAAWIAENGLDTYKKQYNGGWDSATYGQGEKKAKSGEASPAWMDGYTDRVANPGKAGIANKWAALKSPKAPVAKI